MSEEQPVPDLYDDAVHLGRRQGSVSGFWTGFMIGCAFMGICVAAFVFGAVLFPG